MALHPKNNDGLHPRNTFEVLTFEHVVPHSSIARPYQATFLWCLATIGFSKRMAIRKCCIHCYLRSGPGRHRGATILQAWPRYTFTIVMVRSRNFPAWNCIGFTRHQHCLHDSGNRTTAYFPSLSHMRFLHPSARRPTPPNGF